MAFTNPLASVLKPCGGSLANQLNNTADGINALADSLNASANHVKGWMEIFLRVNAIFTVWVDMAQGATERCGDRLPSPRGIADCRLPTASP